MSLIPDLTLQADDSGAGGQPPLLMAPPGGGVNDSPGGVLSAAGGGGAVRELLAMELCLFCQQPCEVGLFAVEPVWCCSCW